MFQAYLMDRIDLKREHLSIEEFLKIEFEVFGIPLLMVDVISKLSTLSYEIILFKRMKKTGAIKNKHFKRRAHVHV